MKSKKTDTGWIETTVKKFIVTKIKEKFMSIKNWLTFHKTHPEMTSDKRSHCNRCKVKWEDMDDKEGWVNLAITQSDGNMVLCCKCTVEIISEKF